MPSLKSSRCSWPAAPTPPAFARAGPRSRRRTRGSAAPSPTPRSIGRSAPRRRRRPLMRERLLQGDLLQLKCGCGSGWLGSLLLGAVGATVGAAAQLALQVLRRGAGLLHQVLGLGGDGLLELAEDGLDAPLDLLGQILHLLAGLVQLRLDLLGEVAAGHL